MNIVFILAGLLCDFLGNIIFKVLLSIIGFLVGLAISIVFHLKLGLDITIFSIIISLFFGGVGVVISFILYRVALFIQCFVMGFLLSSIISASLQYVGSSIFGQLSLKKLADIVSSTLIISIIVGLALGVLSIVLYKYIVIFITCLYGLIFLDIGLLISFMDKFGGNQILIIHLISLIISIIGAMVQLKTAKNLNPMQRQYQMNNMYPATEGYNMNQPQMQFGPNEDFSEVSRSVKMKKNNKFNNQGMKFDSPGTGNNQDFPDFPEFKDSKEANTVEPKFDTVKLQEGQNAVGFNENNKKENFNDINSSEINKDNANLNKQEESINTNQNFPAYDSKEKYVDSQNNSAKASNMNPGFNNPNLNQEGNKQTNRINPNQPHMQGQGNKGNPNQPHIQGQGNMGNPNQPYMQGQGNMGNPNQPYMQGQSNMGNPNQPYMQGQGNMGNPNQPYMQGEGYATPTIKVNDKNLFIEPEKIKNSFFGMNPVMGLVAKFSYIIFLIYIILSLTFLFSDFDSVFDYFNNTSIIALGIIIILWGLREYFSTIILSALLLISKIRIIKLFIDGDYQYIIGEKQGYLLFIYTVITIISLAIFIFYNFQAVTKTGDKPRIFKIFKA